MKNTNYSEQAKPTKLKIQNLKYNNPGWWQMLPPILYTSCRGKRRGLSVGRLGGRMESRASRRVTPLAAPSFLSIFQPLNQLIYYPLRKCKRQSMNNRNNHKPFRCTYVTSSDQGKRQTLTFELASSMLSPCHPEIGTKATLAGL